MKTIQIILLAAAFCLLSCTPGIRDLKTEKLKIVRVTSPVEAEVIYRGSLRIVSLAGVRSVGEDEFEKNYIATGKINKKYQAETLMRIRRANNFFSSIVAPGDILYAVEATKDGEFVKAKAFIIFMPDMVSINEKMILAGYGFPGKPSKAKEFNNRIQKVFSRAVRARRGLWRIGKLYSPPKEESKKIENDNLQEKRKKSSGKEKRGRGGIEKDRPLPLKKMTR